MQYGLRAYVSSIPPCHNRASRGPFLTNGNLCEEKFGEPPLTLCIYVVRDDIHGTISRNHFRGPCGS